MQPNPCSREVTPMAQASERRIDWQSGTALGEAHREEIR